ncbi:MAG: helix-turn-helix domain-containing protein [Bacteroidota bacterium]
MIWKALSDPTRRTILDLLKKAPQTTGEISSQFAHLSRFAIMKHLTVLEKANLITSRKEGKFRWNYINVKPFRDTYDKWVSNLVKLQYFAGRTIETMGNLEKQLQSITVNVDLQIDASPVKVWKALTEQTSDWWLEEFFTNLKTKEILIETKLGGLMYENTGEGEGFVWANVVGIDIPHSIQLKGLLTPAFGGPAISFLRIELRAVEKATRLRLSDDVFGDISPDLPMLLEVRWRRLLEDGLKRFVEQKR